MMKNESWSKHFSKAHLDVPLSKKRYLFATFQDEIEGQALTTISRPAIDGHFEWTVN